MICPSSAHCPNAHPACRHAVEHERDFTCAPFYDWRGIVCPACHDNTLANIREDLYKQNRE